MQRITNGRAGLALFAASLLVAACAASGSRGTSDPAEPGVTAKLCDGKTEVHLDAAPTTRAGGQVVADTMMATWKKEHPGEDWEMDVREAHTIQPSFDNSALLEAGQGPGDPGRRFTERDLLIWKRETERMVAEGARIFHSAGELRSTIAVSCDMCHPDAANTHPETYPKYQVQLGKVALLRDMINWCLQHPVRAEPFPEDDPRMRALEAYITAQRIGTPLAYGKH